MKYTLTCVVTALSCTACVRHVFPYNHKVRTYEPETYAPPGAARSAGSLWSEGAHNLFEDSRARRVGDILTVRIDENATGARATDTQTARNSSVQIGLTSFWTQMAKLAAANPGLDPNALFAASAASNFAGSGAVSASGQLNAMVPVHIKESLPNGDFYVEGNKVLVLGDEESHLYISGVVRPIDIEPDNSVASYVLADVELEYTGRGVASEPANPGWLSRILSYISPW